MSPQRKAIIIGGGPAGIAAALRLSQNTNISCTIYEVRSEPTTLGLAIGIQSNGLRLLNRLGVYEALAARGSVNSHMTLRNLQGSTLGEQDLVGAAKEQTGFGYLRIKRAELLDALVEAAEKARIPIHYGKRITSIHETEDGVTATFSDGTTDTADMLFGCDGIHSQVRRLYVDPTQQPEYTGFSGLGSTIAVSDLPAAAPSQITGLNATLTQEGMFMVTSCSATDDEAMWMFSKEVAMPPTGDARDGWEVHRQEEVNGFKGALFDLLENARNDWGDTLRAMVEKTDVVKFYPVYRLPLGRAWSKGRCILVGDAAHAMPPHAGQGVSMAMEDVFVLSRLLEDPLRPLSEVCEKYDQIRRPRVDEIAALSAGNAGIRKKSGPWKLWAKETALWGMFSISGVLGRNPMLPRQDLIAHDVEAGAI